MNLFVHSEIFSQACCLFFFECSEIKWDQKMFGNYKKSKNECGKLRTKDWKLVEECGMIAERVFGVIIN